MELTKDDLEWLDRIGVDEDRMRIIFKNQEDIQRINDMMVELEIETPLELWLANSKSWKEDAEIMQKLKNEHMNIDFGLWAQNDKIVEQIKEHYIGTPEHISDCSVCAFLKPIMEENK